MEVKIIGIRDTAFGGDGYTGQFGRTCRHRTARTAVDSDGTLHRAARRLRGADAAAQRVGVEAGHHTAQHTRNNRRRLSRRNRYHPDQSFFGTVHGTRRFLRNRSRYATANAFARWSSRHTAASSGNRSTRSTRPNGEKADSGTQENRLSNQAIQRLCETYS